MSRWNDRTEAQLAKLQAAVEKLGPTYSEPLRRQINRWLGDAGATRFHLRGRDPAKPLVVGIFGGTGTGKSTIVNRLLEQTVTAASFRRTFTSGAIAVVGGTDALPNGWLAVEHLPAAAGEFPVRGQAGALRVAVVRSAVTGQVTIVDTPDLDGDQPAHHAEADRVFRWTEAAIFLVTPEKYQMTELLPYYRLCRRYGMSALYVMNKAENWEAVGEYAQAIGQPLQRGEPGPVGNDFDARNVFAVARDDAAFEVGSEAGLAALRARLSQMRTVGRGDASGAGAGNRVQDLLGRLIDQVIAPLRERRLIVDRLIVSLRAMETPEAGVDVNPVTRQLRQRLQQRSVLYLMGPQRILDRVRQAPGLLTKLPRVAWDYMRTGEISADSLSPATPEASREAPNFPEILADQFALVQSRIDDILRDSPAATGWINDPVEGAEYQLRKIDPADAAKIAEEQIAELKQWLEKRWDATPRDTRALQALLKYLPGGRKLTQWTEAAPYLLTIALVAHHALFPHFDLVVLGGYTLATWLSEKISNEVSSRTRAANQRISDRFARLAHEQIERVCQWLDERAPSSRAVEELDDMAASIEERQE